MTKLTAADLMVICDTLHISLNIAGYGKWAKGTRELTMQKVIVIMEQMNAEVVCSEEKVSTEQND